MVLYFILDRKNKEIFISFAQLIWYIINIKSYKIAIVDENYTKRNNENDTHRKKKHNNKTELSIWLMIRRGATSTNDQIKLGKYISKVINNDITMTSLCFIFQHKLNVSFFCFSSIILFFFRHKRERERKEIPILSRFLKENFLNFP